MWELNHKEVWVPKNWCFWTLVLEKILDIPLESRRSNQSTLKEVNPEYSLKGLMLKVKLQHTLATWCKEPTLWKRPWCWERLREGGEGDDRGWDDWMASLTQWTWVWAKSRRWWRTGKPVMLQPLRPQRIRHDWVTEQQWQQQNKLSSLLPCGFICGVPWPGIFFSFPLFSFFFPNFNFILEYSWFPMLW